MSDDNGWVPISPCAPPTAYLPLAGGTMTGSLILAADPVQPLEAVTKQYADAIIAVVEDSTAIGDNRIINGDMRIDQRNGGASGTAVNAYTVDRWYYTATQASKGSWGRNGPPGISGFPYYLVFTSTSAYAPLAGDAFLFSQAIEADMVSDFAFGTANAQPVTLSFWAASTVSAAFGGALTNYASGSITRSYPFTYTLAANTWTKVVVTIPGDTGGTWTMSGNLGGAVVRFDLGSGTTFRAAAGAWTNGNFVGVTGAANLVSVNGASFQITGVKLEIGSVATPFNRQSLAKSMADCQRYYFQDLGSLVFAFNSWAAAGFMNIPIIYPTSMRAAATVTLGTVSSTTNITSVNVGQPTFSRFMVNILATAAGATGCTIGGFTASAEL